MRGPLGKALRNESITLEEGAIAFHLNLPTGGEKFFASISSHGLGSDGGDVALKGWATADIDQGAKEGD